MSIQNSLNLRCIGGRKGLGNLITLMDLNRPGLALNGFFESFVGERIQLFGRGEWLFLEKILKQGLLESLDHLFTYPIPCSVFTYDHMPPKEFLDRAEKKNVPVLVTTLSSSELSVRLMRVLSEVFSRKELVHGVLVEVSGTGVLLTGESGVGKSESALELIERGHRLIADDTVSMTCSNGESLVGTSPDPSLGYQMEIRGLGIINIPEIFGIGSVRHKKRVDLIVRLEEWDSGKNYDRLGMSLESESILGVLVPVVTIPVKPGRNIPIIIETAAFKTRLNHWRGFRDKKIFSDY